MTHPHPGKFIVFDGLDGIGKGEGLVGIKEYLVETKQPRILDLEAYWFEMHNHPDFENELIDGKPNPYYLDLSKFDLILSAEPTFVGVGMNIREEITAKNGREYSAQIAAQGFSLDRLILYQRVILPALAAGVDVLQSRSVSTSIVYQPLQSLFEGRDKLSVKDILSLEGNILALENAPDLLGIPTIESAKTVMTRLEKRSKSDNSQYENVDFQIKLKPHYEGKVLRDIFEGAGTAVRYIDAGISVESTREQAVKIYQDLFEK